MWIEEEFNTELYGYQNWYIRLWYMGNFTRNRNGGLHFGGDKGPEGCVDMQPRIRRSSAFEERFRVDDMVVLGIEAG